MTAPLPNQLVELLKAQPLPKRPSRIQGYEPTEFELHRIRKCMEECCVHKLSTQQIDWMSYVLIPTIVKYGRYPIPDLTLV